MAAPIISSLNCCGFQAPSESFLCRSRSAISPTPLSSVRGPSSPCPSRNGCWCPRSRCVFARLRVRRRPSSGGIPPRPFVDYDLNGEYSQLVKHMKIDDSFNYALYKQLLPSLKYQHYALRSTDNAFITNIGSYDRQHPYSETEFFEFDRYLFSTWQSKRNGKGKDSLPWGVPID